jgi:hypothetical protein
VAAGRLEVGRIFPLNRGKIVSFLPRGGAFGRFELKSGGFPAQGSAAIPRFFQQRRFAK